MAVRNASFFSSGLRRTTADVRREAFPGGELEPAGLLAGLLEQRDLLVGGRHDQALLEPRVDEALGEAVLAADAGGGDLLLADEAVDLRAAHAEVLRQRLDVHDLGNLG